MKTFVILAMMCLASICTQAQTKKTPVLKATTTTHSVVLSGCTTVLANGGFNFYRSQTSGAGFVKQNPAPIATCAFTDSTVVAGQSYFYVATAVGNGTATTGESAFSNQVGPEVIALPAPDAPTGLQAIAQ